MVDLELETKGFPTDKDMPTERVNDGQSGAESLIRRLRVAHDYHDVPGDKVLYGPKIGPRLKPWERHKSIYDQDTVIFINKRKKRQRPVKRSKRFKEGRHPRRSPHIT